MSLDLPALTAAATARAFALAGSVLSSVLIEDNPTPAAYDPAADTQAMTWEEQIVSGLLYTDTKTAKLLDDGKISGAAQKLLLQAADLSNTPTTKARITVDGKQWRVSAVETVPGNAIVILTLET